ncbi:L-xylulose reductase-like isoform X2 [Branchiostoma floridae]|uniref:L-xylulose reductase-like isoform X2 n=1 Tax=Branchiostoma floridae TaxID=7739 RepID=A0A9J7M767_BRAFL|nr:L-xylulose reductase-like isoform X2 [Branchiostoma floridae]
MEIRFDGKKALVTGAGKGIGRDTAKALVKCGAEVFVLSRTQEDLDSLVQEYPGIRPVQCDLGDPVATKAAVESVGPIDLLVNNAGINIPQAFLDVTLDTFDTVMNVNVRAVLQVSQIIAKGMVERGTGGSIVNVSSLASKISAKACTTYCASKGALDIMSKVMALELGPHKIRVNTVNPGIVMTNMMRKIGYDDPDKAGPFLSRIPLGKFVEVDDVVHAILYLLSDKAAMVNGASLPIDGGFLTS